VAVGYLRFNPVLVVAHALIQYEQLIPFDEPISVLIGLPHHVAYITVVLSMPC
jgi:hypothetical protein